MIKKLLFVVCLFCLIGVVFYFLPSKQTKVISQANFVITHKCAEPQPIDINGVTEKYFSQCFCMISDNDNTEPVWLDMTDVKHIEFTQNTAQEAYKNCEQGCENLCKTSFEKFLSENPEFKIAKRW